MTRRSIRPPFRHAVYFGRMEELAYWYKNRKTGE
jgi:hypothetical protein